MLSNKRKVIKEFLNYYISTTGSSLDFFILTIQKNKGKINETTRDYKEWLALQLFNLMLNLEITLSDCLDYRKTLKTNKVILKGQYLSEIWVKEVLKEINLPSHSVLVDLFDNENSSDLRFSGLNYYNLNYVDMLNTFDFGIGNDFLKDSLPTKLNIAIEDNRNIYFHINPLNSKKKENSAILDEMYKLGLNNKKLLNITYFSILRMILLKEEYSLSNLYFGIYLPLEIFKEPKEYSKFLKLLNKNFEFKNGICFDSRLLGVTTKDKYYSFMLWGPKESKNNKSIVLMEKILNSTDVIVSKYQKVIRPNTINLYDWCIGKEYTPSSVEIYPMISQHGKYTEELYERPVEVLGYALADKNHLKMLKKSGLFTSKVSDSLEFNEFNFWNIIATQGMKILSENINQNTDKSYYLNSPDITVEGYQQWLANLLILVLFDVSNYIQSYRGKYNIPNKLFPLSSSDILRFVEDKNILEDIKCNGDSNTFILKRLKEVDSLLNKESIDLYLFVKGKLRESFRGNYRKDLNYKYNLDSWDCNFSSIRKIKSIFTDEDEERYIYLLSKLKSSLEDGIYKYGFLEN